MEYTIESVTLNEDGLFYGDRKIEEMSDSEQLLISIAIWQAYANHFRDNN